MDLLCLRPSPHTQKSKHFPTRASRLKEDPPSRVCWCHTIEKHQRIPWGSPEELEHKLGGSSGDLQGIHYSVTTALCSEEGEGIFRRSGNFVGDEDFTTFEE